MVHSSHLSPSARALRLHAPQHKLNDKIGRPFKSQLTFAPENHEFFSLFLQITVFLSVAFFCWSISIWLQANKLSTPHPQGANRAISDEDKRKKTITDHHKYDLIETYYRIKCIARNWMRNVLVKGVELVCELVMGRETNANSQWYTHTRHIGVGAKATFWWLKIMRPPLDILFFATLHMPLLSHTLGYVQHNSKWPIIQKSSTHHTTSACLSLHVHTAQAQGAVPNN